MSRSLIQIFHKKIWNLNIYTEMPMGKHRTFEKYLEIWAGNSTNLYRAKSSVYLVQLGTGQKFSSDLTETDIVS